MGDIIAKKSAKRLSWSVPLVSFFVGIAAGLMIHAFLSGKQEADPGSFETHEYGYNLINPLLKCDNAADTIGHRELRPFQHKVEDLVREMERDGRAKNVAVYFRDLNNGPWFGVEAEERFTPASLLKVPVMIACLKKAESEHGFLRKQYTYRGDDLNAIRTLKASNAVRPGQPYTVDELIELMIAYSDNNARELLRQAVGPELLARTNADLGVHMPIVESSDFMTVRSYASFFRVLFNASYLSKKMSHKALTYLAESDYKEGIAAGAPSTVIVANKFGERAVTGAGVIQLHDCGIVYYPDSPYLLCIMSRGNDFGSLAGTIRDISRLVYTEIDRNRQNN